jgi:hypothetical protein
MPLVAPVTIDTGLVGFSMKVLRSWSVGARLARGDGNPVECGSNRPAPSEASCVPPAAVEHRGATCIAAPDGGLPAMLSTTTFTDLYAEVLQFYARQMQQLDGGDFEAYGDTFTEDAEFRHTHPRAGPHPRGDRP